jgi:Dirigent-like protein
MQVSEGFTLIGEDREQTPMDLSAAQAATVVVFDQTLFQEGDVPWEKGDEVGTMHGVAVVTHGGRAVCTLIFRFDDEDSITAVGVLPVETSSVGEGVITVNGGTGKYRGLSGQVRIETQNPKRYGFQV